MPCHGFREGCVDFSPTSRGRPHPGPCRDAPCREGTLAANVVGDEGRTTPCVLAAYVLCEGGTREGDPSIHRPSRPPRSPSPAQRPGTQSALVLACRDPRPLPVRRPRALGRRRAATPYGCSAAVSAGRLTELAEDRRFLRRLAAVADDLRRLPRPASAGTRRRPPTCPPPSPTSRPSSASPPRCRSTPAASASSPATTSRPPATSACPLIGVGLLYRHGYFRQSLSRDGWQQEHYPVLDPNELPSRPLRERRRHARPGLPRPARRPRAARPGLAGPGRPRPAAPARLRRRGERPRRTRGHRPAVRRRQRAPAAAGDAARYRRGARGPDVLPAHRAPRARGVPHQRGPRGVPRPGADRRTRRRGAGLRRRAGGGPRRHGLHHPHPRPRRHRPLRPGAGRPPLRPRRRTARHRRRADPRASAWRPTPAASRTSSTWP